MPGLVRRATQGVIRYMRGERGQRQAVARHAVDRRAVGFPLLEDAGADHAGEHAVARRLRGLAVAVRPPPFRQLRQRHEEGRLCDGQALRLLAEIGERGCAHAFEIAAIGRQRQVAFEDFALRQPPLDLDGA
jgi:hypothetical protein